MITQLRKINQAFTLTVIIGILFINGCSSSKKPTVPRAKDVKHVEGVKDVKDVKEVEEVEGVKDGKDVKHNIWEHYNGRIASYYMKYRSTKRVKESLERAQKYLPFIHQVFRQHKLPPELAYLPILESSFKADSASHSGAKGIWQFMTVTAKDLGLTVNFFYDERTDWKKATVAAAKYFKKLGKRFNYNWELVLAGYNIGPTYMSRQIRRHKSYNYWDMWIKYEPRHYVPKFLAILRVAKKKYPNLYYRGHKGGK